MAIRLITGVPGSGKSYYGVKHLRDTYFKKTPAGRWVPNSEKFAIISNIENLQLDHLDLSECISKSGLSLNEFFRVDYQEKIQKKFGQVVYFIDEAQRYFPFKFSDNETLYFFQYHRHLGMDIYIMTQNAYLLSRGITSLVEVEVRAVKRTLSVFGEFKYNLISNNEIIDRKILKKDKSIFNLYSSMIADESEKVKNPMIKYGIGLIILLAVSFFLFKSVFFGHFGFNSSAVASDISDPGDKKRAVDNVVGASGSGRSLCRLNIIALGKKIMVVDNQYRQLVPVGALPFKIQSISDQGQVSACYALLSQDEAFRYGQGVRAPASPGETAGRRGAGGRGRADRVGGDPSGGGGK